MQFREQLARAALTVAVVTGALFPTTAPAESPLTERGQPQVQAMSALAFGPDGLLLVGDSKAGAIFAIDLGDAKPSTATKPLNLRSLEEKIAAMLGTSASGIMIHDMAVNPVSHNVYLAVSRGRSEWDSRWLLPNDITDASLLIRVSPDGELTDVDLKDVPHARSPLPNPIDPEKAHPWKRDVAMRSDTITDMSYSDGKLYVAGLSNEEFASTMWIVPFPFSADVRTTTLEIFHGAHGEFETHAPIRTFLPYRLQEQDHLLAAYLCTPLVTFPVDKLKNGQHIRGRTVAEFGSGNFPLDMVLYQKNGQDRLLIANSNLPLMIVDPAEIAAFEGSIVQEVEGYVAGVGYEIRSGAGIQQLDLYTDDVILALQRLPGGTMDLVSMPVERF